MLPNSKVKYMSKVKKAPEEKLVEKGFITQAQLEGALKKQQDKGISLRQILIEDGLVSEDDWMNTMAEALGLTVMMDLLNIIDSDVVKLLPEDLARKYTAIPIFKAEDLMMVAVLDPMDIFALDDIAEKAGCSVKPVLSKTREIQKSIDHFYGKEDKMGDAVEEARHEEGVFELAEVEGEARSDAKIEIDAPIVKLVNMMVMQAIKEKASDIHVEPQEDRLKVRYRCDGVLREVMSSPKELQPMIISRIKIMSGMDIAIKRVPQDGRFKFSSGTSRFDVRVSSVCTVFGEKIVMRLLDQTSIQLELDDLGFNSSMREEFEKVIKQPYGILLVTGPTGSGKSTTLYTCLSTINSVDKNIMTIEDPVEYNLKGVNQIPVMSKIDVTFARILRTALRQDPDIIMIGEMRDTETAETAIRAALTGHFVFSTLHTNDAPGALTRLVDMDIPPYLVASAVSAVLAQRLVRKICQKCKEEFDPPQGILKDLAEKGITFKGKEAHFYRGKGCDECGQKGYKGRIGVYEFMMLSDEIGNLVINHATADVVRAAARKAGMRTLLEDGVDKVLQGITTLEEVQRVLLTSEV